MKKIFVIFAAVSLLSFGWAAESQAMGSMGKGSMGQKDQYTAHETQALIGTVVVNKKGEDLGSISDFVIDSRGRVILAVLYQGPYDEMKEGKYVAIPFNTLAISGEEPEGLGVTVVLNMDKEQLESAPSFNAQDLKDRKKMAEVYRYFGQVPYWTIDEARRAAPFAGPPDYQYP